MQDFNHQPYDWDKERWKRSVHKLRGLGALLKGKAGSRLHRDFKLYWGGRGALRFSLGV